MTAIIVLHCIICALLIVIILIQAGRGGGFVESLAGVESMFGTKTSAFLTKATSILATLFFVTCVGLAFMSAQRGKSLLRNVKTAPVESAAAVNSENPAPAKVTDKSDTQPSVPLDTKTPEAAKTTEPK